VAAKGRFGWGGGGGVGGASSSLIQTCYLFLVFIFISKPNNQVLEYFILINLFCFHLSERFSSIRIFNVYLLHTGSNFDDSHVIGLVLASSTHQQPCSHFWRL
jgi:hypothetical protein